MRFFFFTQGHSYEWNTNLKLPRLEFELFFYSFLIQVQFPCSLELHPKSLKKKKKITKGNVG